MSIEVITNLAKKAVADYQSDTATIYLLENLNRAASTSEINRTCGYPIGVSDDLWPRYGDRRMLHLLTLDLDSVPALQPMFPEPTRAVSCFISDYVEHEAVVSDNDHIELLYLEEEMIDQGENRFEIELDEKFNQPRAGSFRSHELTVPIDLFKNEIFELDEAHIYSELLNHIIRFDSYASRKPLTAEPLMHEEMILSFGSSLIDMNLGDGWGMYIFKNTGFIAP